MQAVSHHQMRGLRRHAARQRQEQRIHELEAENSALRAHLHEWHVWWYGADDDEDLVSRVSIIAESLRVHRDDCEVLGHSVHYAAAAAVAVGGPSVRDKLQLHRLAGRAKHDQLYKPECVEDEPIHFSAECDPPSRQDPAPPLILGGCDDMAEAKGHSREEPTEMTLLSPGNGSKMFISVINMVLTIVEQGKQHGSLMDPLVLQMLKDATNRSTVISQLPIDDAGKDKLYAREVQKLCVNGALQNTVQRLGMQLLSNHEYDDFCRRNANLWRWFHGQVGVEHVERESPLQEHVPSAPHGKSSRKRRRCGIQGFPHASRRKTLCRSTPGFAKGPRRSRCRHRAADA